jgi:hypothetical protein
MIMGAYYTQAITVILNHLDNRERKSCIIYPLNYFSQLFSRHCLCDWMVCVVTCILRLMYVLLTECQIVEKLFHMEIQ